MSTWKTVTGRAAREVLLRIFDGGLSRIRSMKLDFPVPAAPYKRILLICDSTCPSFMASLRRSRDSLVPAEYKTKHKMQSQGR